MNFLRSFVVFVFLFIFSTIAGAEAPNTISYQGKLADGSGMPLNSTVALTFGVYNADSGGDLLWTETLGSVDVVNGLFTVTLGADIGNPMDVALFAGADRYLGIAVDAELEMTPRQKLTSVPFAIHASSAVTADAVDWTGVTSVPAEISDGDDDTLAGLGCADTQIAGYNGTDWVCVTNSGADTLAGLGCTTEQIAKYNGTAWVCIDDYETRIAALEALLTHFSVAGNEVTISGANLNINSGSGTTAGIINGLGNLVVGYNEVRGSGDDRTGSHNIIVGYQQNFSSYGGLVAGVRNTISGAYSSVSGGANSIASGDYSSVSGGLQTTASGIYSSVTGGQFNTASGSASSVSGGQTNTASGQWSTVSGGANRSVSGVGDWQAGSLFEEQ